MALSNCRTHLNVRLAFATPNARNLDDKEQRWMSVKGEKIESSRVRSRGVISRRLKAEGRSIYFDV
jgi:hypothetical protein